MGIEVVEYTDAWPRAYERVAGSLRAALQGVPDARVEHVGSTSVPGLAAKPIIDIDVVVAPADVAGAIEALGRLGYRHRGDLGIPGREAMLAPDDDPARNVYVCAAGTIHVRNHLAVRDLLRRRSDLRDAYAATKIALGREPGMTIDRYVAGKSDVLAAILGEAGFTKAELDAIADVNQMPSHGATSG